VDFRRNDLAILADSLSRDGAWQIRAKCIQQGKFPSFLDKAGQAMICAGGRCATTERPICAKKKVKKPYMAIKNHNEV
jgi:hypothetical protein